jgi:hypothetical protein
MMRAVVFDAPGPPAALAIREAHACVASGKTTGTLVVTT